MYYLIFIIAGVIIGGGVAWFITSLKIKKTSGTLVIDTSDPLKDTVRFEMDESLETIYGKKRIILNVKTYT